MDIDLTYEHKTQCPKCASLGRDRSADNLHVYGRDSDGRSRGAKCFACDFVILSDEYKENYGIVEIELEEYVFVASEFNAEIYKKLVESTGTDSKGYRGIRRDISESLGVRYGYSTEDGSVTETYYPITKGCLTKDKAMCGLKIRKHPKTFLPPIGEADNSCDLFMQWKFKTHRGMLLITAGEVDAMSAYQMLYDMHQSSGNAKKYDEIAVVSGITGEGGMAAQLRGQYEWLSQFSKIIIAMDNDVAGKKATEQIAAVLPKGKAFVADLRYKDINEYLEKGDEQAFINDFWGHKAYTPDGIYASSDLFQDVLKQAFMKKLSLPPFMSKVQDMLGGVVSGEIFTIFGDTSIGKSLFVDSLIEHIITSEPNEVVGVISLEADKAKYTTNLLARHLGVNLNRMEGQERVDYLIRPDIKEKVDSFLTREDGKPSFYVYDNRGVDLEETKKRVYEMIKSLGVTTLCIDPYSDLTSSLSREDQDKFTIWLKTLTLEFPHLTIIVVAHTRKRDIDSQVTEQDIIGSSILAKSSAQTISLERNKLEECAIKRNTTTVTIQKNRPFQTTGIAQKIYFNSRTGRLEDYEEWAAANPHMFVEE